jgi:hypothetical protein
MYGLEISSAGLDLLPDAIGSLSHVIELILTNNRLSSLVADVGRLSNLKFLVLDGNGLHSLPPSIASLTNLQTLNISQNAFEEFPNVICHIPSLATLNINVNKISHLPSSIRKLKRVSTLHLAHNVITDLPASIGEMESLRFIDISSNQLRELPCSLSNCAKLKELVMADNPFSDNKLTRLSDSSAKTKDVLKILRDGQSKAKVKAKKSEAAERDRELTKPQVEALRYCGSLDVVSRSATRGIRPFLVCCIVRGISLSEDAFKRFISMQTEIHEGLGQDRKLACLGTHDLDKIKGPYVYYESDIPEKIRFQPLKYDNEVTARELLQLFETDVHMKRHLDLVIGANSFPFLMDSDNKVLSLLPLVNSEYSKVTTATKDVFIESSSDTDLQSAKDVMDALVIQMYKEGIINTSVKLEQTRVVDDSGNVRVVYPSRVDLPSLCLNWNE